MALNYDQNNTPNPKPPPSGYGKIFLSDVVVTRPAGKVFRAGRMWNYVDLVNVSAVVSVHVLGMLAPFYVNWNAVFVMIALAIITMLFGVNLSYHRNLAHRSFKLPKWLEYIFAYFAVLALQGHPINWVNTHRYHHQFTDTEKDPHSPLEGFWYSHLTWLFDNAAYKAKKEGVAVRFKAMDLQRQFFYRFMQHTYVLHPLALGLLLYYLGGFSFVVWGMGVRTMATFHGTWLINSACHVWGKQAWNTGDLSRNTWWLALISFGEGWHNNHHAFEYSARHGLEWWQLDMTWYVIWFLQAVGLATEVKLPTEAHKQKLAFKTT